LPVLIKRPAVRDATVCLPLPNTGLNVQGWVADDPTEGEGKTNQPITCTICTQRHSVNPKIGSMLGTDEDYAER
jgi:hypothetical protein